MDQFADRNGGEGPEPLRKTLHEALARRIGAFQDQAVIDSVRVETVDQLGGLIPSFEVTVQSRIVVVSVKLSRRGGEIDMSVDDHAMAALSCSSRGSAGQMPRVAAACSIVSQGGTGTSV